LPERDLPSLLNVIEPAINMIPSKGISHSHWQLAGSANPEGLVIPTQVNYVGKGADLYGLGYELHGSIQVVLNYLRTTWLWDKVRIQGGAYSASNSFGRQSGVLTMASYRDPNILETLDVFDGAGQFLRSSDIHQDEIRKSIIGAIGAIDAYRLPDAKGYVSFIRHLIEESDETRQMLREQVLGASLADFRRFADVLDQVKALGQVSVVGSQEAFQKAHEERSGYFTLLDIL
ncbi:MAG: peptidase M16, partial [Anaerolineales bacterium]|nr:peptidase M16 [Anaerolineales bacterium]